MVKGNGKYVFKFHRLHKSSPCGKPIASLEFHEYSEDKSLCVVTTLDEYIKRTVNWREGTKTQLLLGYIKPHVEVPSSTVSRCIKETLKLSGIDVTTFKGHPTWAASSSKVGSIGLSVSTWQKSQKSRWQRFIINQLLVEMRHINQVF